MNLEDIKSSAHKIGESFLKKAKGKLFGKEEKRLIIASANSFRDSRDFESAARLYMEYVEKGGTRFDIMVQAGNCLKEIGKYKEAMSYYSMALNVNPENSDIHLQIGHLKKIIGENGPMIRSYVNSAQMNNQDAYRELMVCVPDEPTGWAVVDLPKGEKPRPHWVPADPDIRLSSPKELLKKELKKTAIESVFLSKKIRNGNAIYNIDKEYQSWKMASLFSSYSDIVSLYAMMSGLYGRRSDKVSNEITSFGLGVLPVERMSDKDEHFGRGDILDRYRERQILATKSFEIDLSDIGTKDGSIKVSILMPIYKGPPIYVERAIVSVLCQSYKNIELCVVDDFSDSREIDAILNYYASYDSRVKYKKLEKNSGISHATNVAMQMSSGKYIALLDHDDLLAQKAVEKVVASIEENPDIDLLYTDECKIDENDLADEIFTKPDWSPSLLKSIMYTGHFSVYRRDIIEKVGGFRSKYDFSQDYDLALRVSALSPKVYHLAECLYGWRMIPGSAAMGGKPMARLTNISALQDYYDKKEISGKAVGLRFSNRMVKSKENITKRVSIIIPSDNPSYIEQSIASIIFMTTYENYEIVVVCNSECKEVCKKSTQGTPVVYVDYNDAYNFSDKCNRGAEKATGSYYIFYNDDVRVTDPEWISVMVEAISEPEVGVVGPKLLYENGAIQHAGMVTGVRNFVGTAFHTYLDQTPAHFGFAQCLREVSLICGACLMIKSDIFEKIQGFDSVNAPIAHSDVDICFKVRELGYSCVYTPYTSLIHFGHLSIGAQKKKKHKKNKADIYMIKRWNNFISYDPFFPPGMRDLVYIDSPTKIEFFLHGKKEINDEKKDILLVSHDLTGSGAPKVLFDMAKSLSEDGHYVLVMSPTDGVFRKRLQEQGIDVIIDPLCIEAHETFVNLAKNFDVVVCNTIVSWRIPPKLKEFTSVFLYTHESDLLKHFADSYPDFVDSLRMATGLIAAGPLAAKKMVDITGIEPFVLAGCAPRQNISLPGKKEYITIAVAGTYEPRKGQDIAIVAYEELPASYQKSIKLKFAGRTNDKHFRKELESLSRSYEGISFFDELDHNEILEFLKDSDIVLVPSRDDPLPLVAMEALSLGKIVICADTVGTFNYIEDEVSGFRATHLSPDALAAAIMRALKNKNSWNKVSNEAQKIYEEHFSPDIFKLNVLNYIKSV